MAMEIFVFLKKNGYTMNPDTPLGFSGPEPFPQDMAKVEYNGRSEFWIGRPQERR
jgi:hypothetical protein